MAEIKVSELAEKRSTYGEFNVDLHERLLPFDSSLLIDFAPVLPLISSG